MITAYLMSCMMRRCDKDKYMTQEARVYINFETGYHSKFRNCDVIPIHNIRLVIGGEK